MLSLAEVNNDVNQPTELPKAPPAVDITAIPAGPPSANPAMPPAIVPTIEPMPLPIFAALRDA